MSSELPPGSSSSTLRSIFLGASLCWNVAAVLVSALMGVHAFSSLTSSPELEIAAWLSTAFSLVIAVQGFLAFVKLKISLQRYVRFGLSSAAFSRTSPRLALAYMLTSLFAFALYVFALVEFIDASKSAIPAEAKSGRLGVVWFSILGALMLSLFVGLVIVSRIPPAWASHAFVRTPE